MIGHSQGLGKASNRRTPLSRPILLERRDLFDRAGPGRDHDQAVETQRAAGTVRQAAFQGRQGEVINCKISTTSLKLPDALKKRIAALVEGSGRSAHAFMVEENAESFREFLQDAREAQDEVLSTGKAYDAEEVFAYLVAKAQGSGAKRPRAKRWQRSS